MGFYVIGLVRNLIVYFFYFITLNMYLGIGKIDSWVVFQAKYIIPHIFVMT